MAKEKMTSHDVSNEWEFANASDGRYLHAGVLLNAIL
jgi:hypothetical protein